MTSLVSIQTQAFETARLERQQPLNLSIPNAVSIIGVGGVGSWIALLLAMIGVPQLYIWDGDTIEASNLNRLPYGPATIGYPKVHALSMIILDRVPRCNISTFYRIWYPETAKTCPSDWIVAATDQHSSRVELYDYAKANNISYIEASAEGEYGGCTDSPAMFTLESERQRGYNSVPVWAGPCIMAASMAVHRIVHPLHTDTFNYRLGFNPATHKIELQEL
jgi:tRNA A37 threonylcarbamoyladenosine dehydratase